MENNDVVDKLTKQFSKWSLNNVQRSLNAIIQSGLITEEQYDQVLKNLGATLKDALCSDPGINNCITAFGEGDEEFKCLDDFSEDELKNMFSIISSDVGSSQVVNSIRKNLNTNTVESRDIAENLWFKIKQIIDPIKYYDDMDLETSYYGDSPFSSSFNLDKFLRNNSNNNKYPEYGDDYYDYYESFDVKKALDICNSVTDKFD